MSTTCYTFIQELTNSEQNLTLMSFVDIMALAKTDLAGANASQCYSIVAKFFNGVSMLSNLRASLVAFSHRATCMSQHPRCGCFATWQHCLSV